jgi:hypothetical protein
MKQWLSSSNLYSERLHRKYMDEIDLLVDHYSRLLHAEGKSYRALVNHAYGTRAQYEVYLQQLSGAEQDVDRALAEIRGGAEEIWERLRVEQIQVMELRTKEVKHIFLETEW